MVQQIQDIIIIRMNLLESESSGLKSIKCQFCDKVFSIKGHLTGREYTHAGEKLFQCKFCGNGFSLKGALTRHQRTHTGEKSFTCKF